MAKEYTPTEIVERLAKEGKSEKEIFNFLEKRGLSPAQIDKAINNVIKKEVEGPSRRPNIRAAPLPNRMSRHPEEEAEEIIPKKEEEEISIPESLRPIEIPGESAPEVYEKSIGRPPEKVAIPEEVKMPEQEEEGDEEKTGQVGLDELIEEIVGERLSKFKEKIIELHKKTEAIGEEVESLKAEIGGKAETGDKEKALFGMLEETNKNISDLAGRVSSLEEAFKGLANYLKRK